MKSPPQPPPSSPSQATESALSVTSLSYAYGDRQALDDLSIDIKRGEIFAFLGPNGGGKTTLFRILSTLLPCPPGAVDVLGYDLATQPLPVRSRIGVVFQAPSLDKKLTVLENIRHQAALYGVRGATLRQREQLLLDQFGLSDRRHERTETLSGGLRRRVELAKGMIHQPRLLLLDEPSTGLDPGARSDLWQHLTSLQRQLGVTVVMTTHLLEEAEKADRIAILHQGRLVASDTPNALRATVGGDSITLTTRDATGLVAAIERQFQIEAQIVDGRVRLEQEDAGTWIAKLVEAFPGMIDALTLAKPSLEDVFINKTGHRFAGQEATTDPTPQPAATAQQGLAMKRDPNSPTTAAPGHAAPLHDEPIATVSPWSVAATLCRREIVRFFRQRNRVIGAVGQPILFWLLFGAGLHQSFRIAPDGASGMSFLEYYFPGTLILILLFTAIFATISIIEDRREGFLQSVLVAPIPRWSMVLGKVLGGSLIAVAQGVLFLVLSLVIQIDLGFLDCLGLVAFLFVTAFGLTSLGFVLAWRMESTQGFHAIMNLLLMPMWLLSGAFFPIPPAQSGAAMSQLALHWCMRINPVTYGVAGVRRLLYSSEQLADLWTPELSTCWLVTLGFALITFAACWKLAGKHTTGDLL